MLPEKRKLDTDSTTKYVEKQQFNQESWRLFKCRKMPHHLKQHNTADQFDPDSNTLLGNKFRVKLEICSPDSFAVTPEALRRFAYPGEEECLRILNDVLADVMPSHYTQNHRGGKAPVYKIKEYDAVLGCLKNIKDIEVDRIPWTTLNVVERLSHSFIVGRWTPHRPEHLSDEQVDDLIGKLPKRLVDAFMPFQLEGVKFGLRRGGRCLLADEMGVGKTIQAIGIAGCFINDGHILVVCPAVLRYSWAEELERWLPFCLPSDIHLVFGHQDSPAHLTRCPKVVVISYTMLHRLRKTMLEREWAFMIVDESHHLRCSKKASEPEEITTVLELAAKVKRIVLLSGTPSLSRPGLLGSSKYEYAKTYCDIKLIHGQGNTYQDFSRGVRLEELNVLLRQTVMIRRLKEHVLVELPPKRRQIIRLSLKKSDIALAKAALSARHMEKSEKNIADETTTESDDETNENLGTKLQELAIAKLSGFCEWLSIHPLFSESVGVDELDSNSNSHKMIIFAHHHKVLDGIQDFVCGKGVKFVRIDGNTFARDRQAAVQSFQFSNEVKVAIIGIQAGGVGLNFSAAQDVAFVELPQNPSLMLQAEDRAHRKGQTKAVNIYIFCAKDTMDESHWQSLNKSLNRVSSTMNGKYDAVQEIAVENISDLDLSSKVDRSFEPQASELAVRGDFSDSECSEDFQPLEADGEMASEMREGCKLQNKEDQSHLQTSESAGVEQPQPMEASCSSNQEVSLRFEVSTYTGRIHMYSCNPGTDSRPRPLFESYRPDELESQNFPANNDKDALLAFYEEWNKLRPIERKKLFGKPLQIPLSVELCYLEESLNHNSGGLLKSRSKRRTTPLNEISLPLPEHAVWKTVCLRSGFSKKEREYTQGYTLTDEPLCKLCQKPCEGSNSKTPEYFEDLFCNLGCYEEFRLRTSKRFLRQELFQIEHGVCTTCKLDCHKLVKHLKPLSKEKREKYIEKVAPKVAGRKTLLDKLVNDPIEGNAWHADHIVAVYQGGGECRLENMRTLCVACHADVTAAQQAERRKTRTEAKKQLKAVMKELKNHKSTKKTNTHPRDVGPAEMQVEDDILDKELFVKVPGSAYSRIEGIIGIAPLNMGSCLSLFLLLAFFSPIFAQELTHTTLVVDGTQKVAQTDDNFLCATIDWWPHDKCNYDQCPWSYSSAINMDLSHPLLAKAMQAFKNLRIRIGGSLQDEILYDVPSLKAPCHPFVKTNDGLFGFSKGCLHMSRWDELNHLFNRTGVIVTFGLNALYGRHQIRKGVWGGDWDPTNARDFMKYTISKGYKIDSWEFGNELSGKGVGASVDAELYGKDVINLKNIIDDLYKDARSKPALVAPGGFFDQDWFAKFLRVSGSSVVNAVSHHIYNLGAGSDPTLVSKILDPNYLNRISETFNDLKQTIQRDGPWASAWVGESGGAYNSGGRDVSDTFVNSFWYVDQLGMASRYDTKVYCRQTLIGGNYGLLSTGTFVPNPDYYSALLWHRLVGKGVLSIGSDASSYLRTYAHCSKGRAGITLVLINLSNQTEYIVSLRNSMNIKILSGEINIQTESSLTRSLKKTFSWIGTKASDGPLSREEYHLTPKDGYVKSKTTVLNGIPIRLSENGDIPDLEPVHNVVNSPLTISPLSIAFVVFPNFDAPACV
ncbi:hypothetical protein ACFE04_025221 [Oxalis oulophora]